MVVVIIVPPHGELLRCVWSESLVTANYLTCKLVAAVLLTLNIDCAALAVAGQVTIFGHPPVNKVLPALTFIGYT